MGVKPGVGMHQIGMRNAPQAGMAGICLGHGHGGNDNIMTVVSQAGFSLQTPESADQKVGSSNLSVVIFSSGG